MIMILKRHFPNRVAIILLAVLVIVLCSWLAMTRLAMTRLAMTTFTPTREEFADTIFNTAELKSFKSDAYDNAGIKKFYSDGKLGQNHIFFNPSTNDIVCKLGSSKLSETGCEPNKNAVDAVSCADTWLTLYPRAACSRQYMTSPAIGDDCKVRILDSMYRFSKICVTLKIEAHASQTKKNHNPNEFILRSREYSTILLILLRPIFIRGAHCRLVQPHNYIFRDELKLQFAMRSKTDSRTSYKTRPVTEPTVIASDDSVLDIPAVATHVARIFKKKRRNGVVTDTLLNMVSFSFKVSVNDSQYSDKTDTDDPIWVPVPITLYYMTFLEPVDMTRIDAQVPVYVITLYIPTTDPSDKLFSMDNPQLSMTWKNRNGKDQLLVINTSQGALPLTAPPGGHVVLTYTTTLLIYAYMSPDFYLLTEIGSMPNLASTDRSILTRATEIHPPPAAAYPYTNGCIPNLADLAIKLGYLNP